MLLALNSCHRYDYAELVVRSTKCNPNLRVQLCERPVGIFPRFLILMFAWQRFTEEDWSIIPQGQPGRTFTCDNDVEITLVEDQSLIHHPYGIVGHSTTVLRATSTCNSVPFANFPEEKDIPEILDTTQKRAADFPDVTQLYPNIIDQSFYRAHS